MSPFNKTDQRFFAIAQHWHTMIETQSEAVSESGVIRAPDFLD